VTVDGWFLICHQTQGLWSGHQTQLDSVQSCETAKIVDTGALTAQLAELYAHDIWNLVGDCAVHLQNMLVDILRWSVYRIPVSVRYTACNTHHTKGTLPEILLLVFPNLVMWELQRTLSASI